MLLKAARLLLLSFPFSTLANSLKWRSELQQRQLAALISSVLLHRKNWAPLLLRSKSTLLLRRHPTPDLILRILHRTHSHPDISFSFFHWARSSLAFQPDLRSLCKMAQILIDSNLIAPANQLLDPVLRSEPSTAILDSMLRPPASPCKDSRCRVLSFLLESYSKLRLIDNSLETLRMIREMGCQPSTRSCNALLEALCSSNQTMTAWRSYAAIVRTGTSPDARSWSLLTRLLCREGKLERAALLLRSVFRSTACYDLVIDCYCQGGYFGAAFRLLDEMHEKDLKPWLGTYSSILDGGCKFGDDTVVDSILQQMVVRGLLPTIPFLDYNWAIRRFCELERTYAAEFFFARARDENFQLGNGSFTCMLSAFSKEGRVDEAMKVYGIMLREGVDASRSSCYDVFLAGICKWEPSCEANQVLKDSIGGGVLPSVADLSKYIAAQCCKGWWVEASDLLIVALENGVLTEALCCCTLMEHYCTTGLLHSAMLLHDKMERLGGCLDATSYNLLLKALLAEKRIEEAMRVFVYMQARNVMDSAGFVIMIGALCRAKELRRAMKLHDEMLKLGLKPDNATYKHLISGFV